MRMPAAFVLALLVMPASARAQGQGGALRGKVLETLESGGYSYLRLATASGEIWAAVPRSAVAAGAEVGIANPIPMDGFESKTLKRTFDRIVFGTLAGQQSESETSLKMPMDSNHAGVIRQLQGEAHQPAAANPAIKVDRAAGPAGHTVAELYAGKSALKDQQVMVRGQVVKSSANILGRNWLHLQDGSGGDLVVTTRDAAAVGEVVLVSGTLRLERDFGAGYRYDLLVEDARLAR